MQRINRIDETRAPAEASQLLAAVKSQMGLVPNIMATLARSPAALGGYLKLAGAVAGGKLPGKLREQIALAVAGANDCDYCASAHTAIGSGLGVDPDEATRNLRGRAGDPRTEAALRFAVRVLETRGNVSDRELAAVRDAGYSDEEVVEILANTVLNIFTNYFNHVAGTEIDFPVVRAGGRAAA